MRSPSRLIRRVSAATCLFGAIAVLMGPAAPASPGRPASTSRRSAAAAPGGNLAIYYRSPVLVRPGERVLVPVDVVCATAGGRACAASATISAGPAPNGWREVSARARPGVMFDLTAPVRRADTGSLPFRLAAHDSLGRTTFLPGLGRPPLRVYVAARMPNVRLPAAPFGHVVRGDVVLYLPWGTGAMRAGLAPGMEAATSGPSSFDVDGRGRIYLADPMQSRVAVFRGERLVRQTRLSLSPRTDLALASGGTVTLGQQAAGGSVAVQAVDRGGHVSSRRVIGEGILSELRTAGGAVFARLLPLDAWVGTSGAGTLSVAEPLGGGPSFLKAVDGNSVRLAMVSHGKAIHAVELQSKVALGELALARPDGRGGYWAVVHVWRDRPTPADQYQVIHVRGRRVLETFAVAAGEFAETMPLSRFRLGRDGNLYQITSSPDGMRILRYRIGGES